VIRKLLPRIRWVDVPRAEAAGLGFSAHYRWQALMVEWLSCGVMLCVRPKSC
jgi:hypothetical protein